MPGLLAAPRGRVREDEGKVRREREEERRRRRRRRRPPADGDRADYERYAAQMPFPAIAWDDEAGAREQLAAAASLRGIPTLLLVRGSDGRVLQEDGKTRVLRDPGLERWPWEGIKPATNILPLWAQWLALGAFYLVMKFFAKSFRGWMGW